MALDGRWGQITKGESGLWRAENKVPYLWHIAGRGVIRNRLSGGARPEEASPNGLYVNCGENRGWICPVFPLPNEA